MTYIHGSSRANLDALRIRRQIAAAEVERQERELTEIRDAELDLIRLQRRKEEVARLLAEARERTAIKRRQLALPLPVYGGAVGLLAAAQEIKQHTRRKKEMAG